jgi:hypothetical protein
MPLTDDQKLKINNEVESLLQSLFVSAHGDANTVVCFLKMMLADHKIQLAEVNERIAKMQDVIIQARACLMSWTTESGFDPMSRQFQKMIGELTDCREEYLAQQKKEMK